MSRFSRGDDDKSSSGGFSKRNWSPPQRSGSGPEPRSDGQRGGEPRERRSRFNAEWAPSSSGPASRFGRKNNNDDKQGPSQENDNDKDEYQPPPLDPRMKVDTNAKKTATVDTTSNVFAALGGSDDDDDDDQDEASPSATDGESTGSRFARSDAPGQESRFANKSNTAGQSSSSSSEERFASRKFGGGFAGSSERSNQGPRDPRFTRDEPSARERPQREPMKPAAINEESASRFGALKEESPTSSERPRREREPRVDRAPRDTAKPNEESQSRFAALNDQSGPTSTRPQRSEPRRELRPPAAPVGASRFTRDEDGDDSAAPRAFGRDRPAPRSSSDRFNRGPGGDDEEQSAPRGRGGFGGNDREDRGPRGGGFGGDREDRGSSRGGGGFGSGSVKPRVASSRFQLSAEEITERDERRAGEKERGSSDRFNRGGDGDERGGDRRGGDRGDRGDRRGGDRRRPRFGRGGELPTAPMGDIDAPDVQTMEDLENPIQRRKRLQAEEQAKKELEVKAKQAKLKAEQGKKANELKSALSLRDSVTLDQLQIGLDRLKLSDEDQQEELARVLMLSLHDESIKALQPIVQEIASQAGSNASAILVQTLRACEKKFGAEKCLALIQVQDTTTEQELYTALGAPEDDSECQQFLKDAKLDFLVKASDDSGASLDSILVDGASTADILSSCQSLFTSGALGSVAASQVCLHVLRPFFASGDATIAADEPLKNLLKFVGGDREGASQLDVVTAVQQAWFEAGADRKRIKNVFPELINERVSSAADLCSWRDDMTVSKAAPGKMKCMLGVSGYLFEIDPINKADEYSDEDGNGDDDHWEEDEYGDAQYDYGFAN